MPKKPNYGKAQKIFDQVQNKIDGMYLGLKNTIESKDSNVLNVLHNAILVGYLRNIIEHHELPRHRYGQRSDSLKFADKLVEIEQELKNDSKWNNTQGDDRHQMFLKKIEEYAKKDMTFKKEFEKEKLASRKYSLNPKPKTFHRLSLDSESDYIKLKVGQKQIRKDRRPEHEKNFYNFIMMLAIVSITNPQIEQTYLLNYLPINIREVIQEFRLEVIGMLLSPHDFLTDSSTFPSITDKHANNFVRTVLLEKLYEGRNVFDHENWNTFFPYNKIEKRHSEDLQDYIAKMYQISSKISQVGDKYDVYYSRAILAKRVSKVTLFIGFGLVAAGGATAALCLISGGTALLAIGIAAAIAYNVYKHKVCSTKEALIKEQNEYFNSKIGCSLDPEIEEGAEMYNDISRRMREISDKHISPEHLKSKMEKELLSDLGTSITSSAIEKILEIGESKIEEKLGFTNMKS
jgi:hypothetical protein